MATPDMKMTQLSKTIQDVLKEYFNDVLKRNSGSSMSEELLTGMIVKLQGKLIERVSPLILKGQEKENKNV